VIRTRPKPRLAVIEDVDEHPGQGAVVSDVHASILRALECDAVITNGSVRNIPALSAMGFPAFACHISVSHAYVHIVQHSCPVEILGLSIKPADLLYADVHGVIALPKAHLADILRIARELAVKERTIIDFCHSPSFSIPQLRGEIQRIRPKTL
jgi:4-hydroxy-4-methyl-2-oxoglutarate aldolase